MELGNEVHKRTIINSPFDWQGTWTYYHAVCLPSMTYVLTSTDILEETLEKMQRKIKVAVLPKYNFNRHTPSTVVYSGLDYGGINMHHLITKKGLS